MAQTTLCHTGDRGRLGMGTPGHLATPPQRHYESWLDDHRIDPSAMFYTEVEMFEPILKRREACNHE
ncbi:MAG: hypothetical protein R3B96_08535 [Pirellulaceae bacterium]